jgi:hypothetical protein
MLLNPLTDSLPARGLWDDAPPSGGANLRKMAQGLRSLARDCRFPGARREVLDLATKLDRRADYLDWRNALS